MRHNGTASVVEETARRALQGKADGKQGCPAYCNGWKCDGSAWCAGGAQPAPCAVCPGTAIAPETAQPGGAGFGHAQCTALLQDRGSQLHKLWGAEGWRKREAWRNDPTCWDGDGWPFFDNAWWGKDCGRNWYSGTPGQLGEPNGGPDKDWVNPHFTAAAPALLGFDRNINWHCHGSDGNHAAPCVEHNVNILSLYGPAVPYNVCRNLEWQVCAAKGQLPGQGGNGIIFSMAPKDLVLDGGPFPLGSCNSYSPRGCGEGYASGDIFYLEVCVYDAICTNRDALWALNAGDLWHCDMDYDGYANLYHSILEPGV